MTIDRDTADTEVAIEMDCNYRVSDFPNGSIIVDQFGTQWHMRDKWHKTDEIDTSDWKVLE